MSREDDAQVAQVLATANSTRETCAREVEATGCVCETLDPDHWEVTAEWGTESILKHDARCPLSLAAKLREGTNMSTEDRTKQLAEEIAGTLFTNGAGEHAGRLVLMAGYPGPERDLGGWSVKAAVKVIEKCIRGVPLKPLLLLVFALLSASCSVWEGVPQQDRTAILAQTIKSGVAALAHQALTEEACVSRQPALWPRAPFQPSFRPEAQEGLMASGYVPGHGPGELRLGPTGCYEISTMVGGDPGNAWVPYTGNASQLVQANYFSRYGPEYWKGSPHLTDGEDCSPANWLNALDHPSPPIACADMVVVDMRFDRGGFLALKSRYYAAFPQAPVTPTPTPPPGPTPPAPTPVLPPSCPPEKPCAPVVCEVCRECPPAAVLVVPPAILTTLREAPNTVGTKGPAARAWKKRLEAARTWVESVNGKPVDKKEIIND